MSAQSSGVVSSNSLWQSYVDRLGPKIPSVIQFCNRDDIPLDKRTALAAAIVLNTAFIVPGLSGACSPLGACHSWVVRIPTVQQTIDIEKRVDRAQVPVDELLAASTEEDSYLQQGRVVDSTLLLLVLRLQGAVLKAKFRLDDNSYTDIDFQRVLSLVESWPEQLASNTDFQKAFGVYWQVIVHNALQFPYPPQSEKVLSFVQTHPHLFTQEAVIALFVTGMNECLEHGVKYSGASRSNELTEKGVETLRKMYSSITQFELQNQTEIHAFLEMPLLKQYL